MQAVLGPMLDVQVSQRCRRGGVGANASGFDELEVLTQVPSGYDCSGHQVAQISHGTVDADGFFLPDLPAKAGDPDFLPLAAFECGRPYFALDGTQYVQRGKLG